MLVQSVNDCSVYHKCFIIYVKCIIFIALKHKLNFISVVLFLWFHVFEHSLYFFHLLKSCTYVYSFLKHIFLLFKLQKAFKILLIFNYVISSLSLHKPSYW